MSTTLVPVARHSVDLSPSIIIQSALALVMAITTTDAIKAAVERASTANPSGAFHHRVAAMLIVIIIVLVTSFAFSKHGAPTHPVTSVTPPPTSTQGVASTSTTT